MKKNNISMFMTAILAVAIVTASLAFVPGADGGRRWAARAGRIEGTVLIAGHPPATSVRVSFDHAVTVQTDSDGNFAFGMVPPGRHTVTASYLSQRYQGESNVKVQRSRTTEVLLELFELPAVGVTEAIIPLPAWASTFQDHAYAENLLLGCDYRSGFTVYDVSDVSAPTLISTSPEGETTCTGLLFDFPNLFVGWESTTPGVGGISVYSLENPYDPFRVSTVDSGAFPYKLFLEDGLLFGVGREYFQIYDVSDLANPVVLSSLPYRSEAVAYRDGYVFLGASPHVLTVLDVSDPSAPAVIWESAEESEAFGRDCMLDGRYLYVGNAESIYLYDVFDPAEPRMVNIVDGAYLAADGAVLGAGAIGTGRLEVLDWSAYYSGRENGVIAIDYQDIHRPRFSWQSDADVPYAMNIAADGNYLYVAAGTEGMRIVTRR